MKVNEKHKLRDSLKQRLDSLNLVYRNKEYNIIVVTLIIVILSRLLMYLVYKISYNFFNRGLNFINSINIWDSEWYRGIIEKGYNTHPVAHEAGDAANWAFFPFYPVIVRLVHYMFSVDIYLLGMIISTIFFIGALLISYIYIVETRKNKVQALMFMLIMSFGMYSFYFSILYTESLYFFLLVLTLYFLHKEKYICMGISGAFLSATRNLGVMIIFAVLVKYTINYLKREDKSLKGYFITAFKNSDLILGICLIPLGIFLYMAYLWRLVGDPMAFSHVQIAWGRAISNPLKQLLNGLFKGDILSIYLSFAAVFAFVCILWLVIEKRWAECVLAILFIIIPLSTGINSLPRYVIGAFVYVLSFTDFIARINNKWLWAISLIVPIIAEFILLFYWFQQIPILT